MRLQRIAVRVSEAYSRVSIKDATGRCFATPMFPKWPCTEAAQARLRRAASCCSRLTKHAILRYRCTAWGSVAESLANRNSHKSIAAEPMFGTWCSPPSHRLRHESCYISGEGTHVWLRVF